MLKLGVCTVVENIEAVAAAGFDYLETSLAGIAAMENPAFEEAYHQVMDAPIGVEVCNCMIPPTLALTGPNVCVDQIETYLAHAFGRAARLGGRLIVFGSGAARQVPDGFPMEAAMRQIEAFLHLCIPHCESTGIRIAIEPLRKAETNVLNTLREGMALAQRVDHPAVGVLGDTFHMAAAQEPLCTLTEIGARLYHVHIAEVTRRVCPSPGDGGDYAAIFDALQAGGYAGRVSIEGRMGDLITEGAVAVRLLHACME